MGDKSWKRLEREAAAILGGERIVRGDDFSKSDVDVKVPDPRARIDAKKYARHAHHTLFSAVERKYVVGDQYAILVTQETRAKAPKLKTKLGVIPRADPDGGLPILATIRLTVLAEFMKKADPTMMAASLEEQNECITGIAEALGVHTDDDLVGLVERLVRAARDVLDGENPDAHAELRELLPKEAIDDANVRHMRQQRSDEWKPPPNLPLKGMKPKVTT